MDEDGTSGGSQRRRIRGSTTVTRQLPLSESSRFRRECRVAEMCRGRRFLFFLVMCSPHYRGVSLSALIFFFVMYVHGYRDRINKNPLSKIIKVNNQDAENLNVPNDPRSTTSVMCIQQHEETTHSRSPAFPNASPRRQGPKISCP